MIGTEEAVQEAQKELEDLIKSLVSVATTTFPTSYCACLCDQPHQSDISRPACRTTSLKIP